LTIFDLAHDPSNPLIDPLSKRLFPYVCRNLYRQIHLPTLSSFTKLLRTVKSDPSLGDLVLTLDTSRIFVHEPEYEVRGEIYEIVRYFPSLISLNSGFVRPTQDAPEVTAIASLKHLSYMCEDPDPEDLYALSTPRLRSVEISFRRFSWPRPVNAERLESVEKLSLQFVGDDDQDPGEEVWPSEVVNVIKCCPNITSLRLFDSVFPDYRRFLTALSSISHIALRLTSLELDSHELPDVYYFASDHLLPRFANLTHLSLGDSQVSDAFASSLRQLPHLISLRLGPDAHLNLHEEDLLPLVQGPTRLPSLRSLILDCFGNQLGRRVQIEDYRQRLDQELPVTSMSEDGWAAPYFANFTEDMLSQLSAWCERDGIEVGGGGATVLEDYADYKIEQGNRGVLHCLKDRTLTKLRKPNGTSLSDHIPIDNLDPENLKLVKTEIPEKNWFRLSLE